VVAVSLRLRLRPLVCTTCCRLCRCPSCRLCRHQHTDLGSLNRISCIAGQCKNVADPNTQRPENTLQHRWLLRPEQSGLAFARRSLRLIGTERSNGQTMAAHSDDHPIHCPPKNRERQRHVTSVPIICYQPIFCPRWNMARNGRLLGSEQRRPDNVCTHWNDASTEPAR